MPHLMFALALNGYLNVYYASPIPRKKETISAGERVRRCWAIHTHIYIYIYKHIYIYIYIYICAGAGRAYARLVGGLRGVFALESDLNVWYASPTPRKKKRKSRRAIACGSAGPQNSSWSGTRRVCVARL